MYHSKNFIFYHTLVALLHNWLRFAIKLLKYAYEVIIINIIMRNIDTDK